ncbi:MAG TPA: glutathionylspermidine synthase family protein [Symbiobacteriaceae bacterium]|nr:glutathionylspermidine synthase family protein [Symbiobacteriaceae bacterium]
MELLVKPEHESRWQACADAAAFGPVPFTRAWSGGQRYTHLSPLVLTAQEHALLFEATAALSGVFARVVEWVQRSPVILPVLGLPPEVEPWVVREPGAGPFSLLARFDWLRDVRGRWWCVECNADTPGGLPEATVWQSLASTPDLVNPNADLAQVLGDALRRWLPGTAGFVGIPGYTEDWENVLVAQGARGGASVAGGLPAVTPEGAVFVGGEPVDSLYRFYPGDWLFRHPDWLGALAAGLPCANPGRALIAQSKAFFALLWHLVDEGQFLTPAEREWVTTFLPRTSLAPLPGRWLAKPYWEREGWGITPGEGEGPAEPFCIYQERIEPVSLPFAGLSATPVVGVYAVEGRPAGYLTRLGGKITDRSAHMVPTFVAAPQ